MVLGLAWQSKFRWAGEGRVAIGEATQAPLESLSLTFADARVERGFLDARAARLAKNTFGCCCFMSMAVLAGVAVMYAEISAGAFILLQFVQLGVLASMMVSILLLIAIVRMPAIRRFLGAQGVELAVVIGMHVLAVQMVFTQPRYVAGVLQVDASELANVGWGEDDCTLILLMDVLVTVSHVMLPVRWKMWWSFQLVALLFCGAPLITWGKMPLLRVVGSLAVLTILIFCASITRWSTERHEREAFLRVAEDLKRHAQMEHRLTQLAEQAAEPPGRRESELEARWSNTSVEDNDAGSSLPSTTHTGAFFKGIAGEGSSDWEQLLRLGHGEHWLVRPYELQVPQDNILGVGGFGMVLPGVYHGAKVALKASRVPASQARPGSMGALAHELRVFRQLRHPNIVVFYGACIDPGSMEVLLVLEYVHGVHLEAFVSEPPRGPDTADRCKLANDVACALRYMHAQRPSIVHGDIKGSNVLVEQLTVGPVAKLVDFGLSRFITKNCGLLGGTVHWMAPEVALRTGPPASSADVFSFGRLLYMIITGNRPLRGITKDNILAAAREGTMPPLRWIEQVPLFKESRALTEACCKWDASSRPSMVQVHREMQDWGNGDEALSDAAAHSSAQSASDASGSWGIHGADGTLGNVEQLLQRARRHLERRSQAKGAPLVPRSGTGTVTTGTGSCRLTDVNASLHPLSSTRTPNYLALPAFAPTPDAMKDLTVAAALNTWNTVVDIPGACCAFHAAVSELLKVHKRMTSFKCRPKFHPHDEWQCPKCKLMNLLHSDGAGQGLIGECNMCGYEELVPMGLNRQPTSQVMQQTVSPSSPDQDSGEHGRALAIVLQQAQQAQNQSVLPRPDPPEQQPLPAPPAAAAASATTAAAADEGPWPPHARQPQLQGRSWNVSL